MIEGLLAPDPGREFDQATFEQGHSETQSFIDLRPGIVARQLQDRGF